MQIRNFNNKPQLVLFRIDYGTPLLLLFVQNGISAGFPSPADDFLDINIDLNKPLIKNPNATFFGQAKGNSMIDAGIHKDDVLVIGKTLG